MEISGEALMSFFSSMVVLAILGVVVWQLAKYLKAKGMNFGEFLNETFVNQQPTFIVACLFGLILAESLLAASIPVVNEFISPLARNVAHFFLGFVSMVVIIGTPLAFSEMLGAWQQLFVTIDLRRKKKSKTDMLSTKISYVLVTTFIFIVMLILDIVIPYANLTILAVGMGKHFETVMMFKDTFNPWFDADAYALSLELINEGEQWKHAEALGYTMYSSWWIYISHISFGFFDGFIAWKFKLDAKLKSGQAQTKSIHQKINEKVNPKEVQKAMKDIDSYLETLIRATGLVKQESWLESKVDHFADIMYNMSDKDAAALTGKVVKLCNSLEEVSKITDDSKKQAQLKPIVKEIHSLFEASTEKGAGFGERLSKRRSF